MKKNTGKVIVETIGNKEFLKNKAILVASHGPFTWGESPKDSVDIPIVLEEIDESLRKKHFDRKHGKNAYCGQK